MNTILKNYRFALSIGSLAIAIFGLSIFRDSTASDLKLELPIKESEASRLADNVRFAQKLDSQREQLAEINKRVAERLTDPGDVATNQQYFYKIEAETNVKIIDVKPGAMAKKKPSAIYTAVPFSLNIQGEYFRLLTFVRRLETGSRFCRINSATLSAGAAAKAGNMNPATPITLNMNVEFLGNP